MEDKGDDCEQLLWVTVIWLICIHSYHHRMSHHKILVLECEKKRPLGRPRCKREDMLKWIFKKLVVAREMLSRFI